MSPRRTCGRGKRAPLVGDQLRRAVARELKPAGVLETFLCTRISAALESFDDAEPSTSMLRDPFKPTQEQIINDLYDALGQLRLLQQHRRKA